ncbi:telomere end-binding protein Pot1 [Schizosaccharomyces octosporus yFS286]|uniref:Protection of telomeres protein 1 n=1 Tax=Schizosaccharomyces octosporus (strain yFS286) TaxID=483514 RepID=S9Q248_SCHOY|nr:telomere end-binding protein Pot1 [Schizosaccharomyces octosporus yFS286]EPX73783.1 telomere end-binding protein Pot1 [Schizosaccharomyces octosporus yFS286]
MNLADLLIFLIKAPTSTLSCLVLSSFVQLAKYQTELLFTKLMEKPSIQHDIEDLYLNQNEIVIRNSHYHPVKKCMENKHQRFVTNLFGIVKTFTPKKQSLRGTCDWVVTVELWDPSCHPNAEGLRIHLFSKTEYDLPEITEEGQILLLQHITIRPYRDSKQGLSKTDFTYQLWNKDLGNSSGNTFRLFHISTEEVEIARLLSICWQKHFESQHTEIEIRPPSIQTSSNIGRELDTNQETAVVTLSEIRPSKRFTFYGQVVKTWYTQKNFTLFVTDFSENEFFYPVTRETAPHMRWRGPQGRYTVRCILWDEHDYYCRNYVQEGDYVFIKNARAKLDRIGQLECVMHGDPGQKYKSSIEKVDPSVPELNSLKERKRSYVKNQEVSEDSGNTVNDQVNPFITREINYPEATDITAHVYNDASEIAMTTISTILHSPLSSITTPRKHRLRVQIVDFWPRDLTKFSVPISDSDVTEYKWMFVFLVRDASRTTLPVIFYNEDAQTLFNTSTIYPCNLKTENQVLLRIRERLFLIWGNLEERVSKLLSKGTSSDQIPKEIDETPWFDIFVTEYIPLSNAESQPKSFLSKRWRAFGTRII